VNRKLTSPELEAALKDVPVLLTPQEAAALLRLKLSTLYRHVSEGRYGGAVKRGKPLRFWRDRLVQEFMQ
jgi:excisionase family DNA binding protein